MKEMGRQFTMQSINTLKEVSSILNSWVLNLDVPEETKDNALKSLGRINEVIKIGEPPKNSEKQSYPWV
jgi:hypothetical protein